ncbi:hypothetical protein, partial [Klebsiella pneumoniae]
PQGKEFRVKPFRKGKVIPLVNSLTPGGIEGFKTLQNRNQRRGGEGKEGEKGRGGRAGGARIK